ncbi:hypothetical protein [Streptomyces sp. NPDC057623]|uniref:hypothetical protein n=1 Tax=Streptomyces sp. NPDC057623 TaxID=3346187 RepID=UPI0036C24E0D
MIDKAKKILIDRCMEEFGSDYSAPLPGEPIVQATRRYGVTDMKTARTYGYHMPKASSGAGEDPGKIAARERTLLFGSSRRASVEANGMEVPAGGCSGKAESIITTTQRPESAISVAQQINSESFTISLKDPLFVKANRRWSACMAERGYKYDSPLKAISDAKFQEADEPTEEEKRVAVMDISCKRETKLMEIWSGVERSEQDVMIRKHSNLLQELRAFQEVEIQNARQVLSKSR